MRAEIRDNKRRGKTIAKANPANKQAAKNSTKLINKVTKAHYKNMDPKQDRENMKVVTHLISRYGNKKIPKEVRQLVTKGSLKDVKAQIRLLNNPEYVKNMIDKKVSRATIMGGPIAGIIVGSSYYSKLRKSGHRALG